MRNGILSELKRHLVQLKNHAIMEFQYRFLGKTGYGDNLLRIRKFGVYHKRLNPNAADPMVYLTLDVEWGDKPYFSQMLDTLKEKNVCAYLFLKGEEMEENPSLLERIIEDGHCVGNHTMNHLNLTQCARTDVLKELSNCEETYLRLTGRNMPKVLRPPFGRIHRPLAKLLYKNGYVVMHWSMHVPDYGEKQPAWKDYEDYLEKRLHNGGIILQHSFSSATAENLGRMIDFCRQKGYRFGEKEDFEELLKHG